MALLIILAIIGGIFVLAGLYLIGIEVSAIITAWTITFHDRVAIIRDKRKERKQQKQAEKEQAKQEELQEKIVQEQEIAKQEQPNIEVNVEDVVEEVK